MQADRGRCQAGRHVGVGSEGGPQSLQIPVVGLLMATHDQQIGAVKVGQRSGIKPIVLPEGSAPPGFSMTTLRYHAGLDIKCRDLGFTFRPNH